MVSIAKFFKKEKADHVFLAAAKVGGIHANNSYRAGLLYDNLMIQNNVIDQSYVHKVKKLRFLGSSCIYTKMAAQPLKEEYLLAGGLEPPNVPYAIAKIVGIKMYESYLDQYGCNLISAMPTNLHVPNDNYDMNNSHVLPALIRKFHEAKSEGKLSAEIWGTGSPKRQFLYVDDLAAASLFLMQNYNEIELVNVGTGDDISIKDLGILIKRIVGYQGDLRFDSSKPDGTPRKLMDITNLNQLGFKHQIDLPEGVQKVYKNYKESLVLA